MTALPYWKEGLTLNEEDKKLGFWMLDDTHFSKPLTPLFASFMIPAVTIGTKRAFETMKLPIAQFIVKTDHGYYYQLMPSHPEPVDERLPKHRKKMEELFPRIRSYLERTVDEFLMPFYNKLAEYSTVDLSATEALRAIEELRQFYEQTWQSHFLISIPWTSLAIELEQLYGQVTGAEAPAEVYDYLQGIMNMSLETDRGLWLLAEQVKVSPLLFAIVTASSNPIETLQHTAEGREFLNDLKDFLNIYGHRTATTHDYSEDTWFENPSYALPLIANYVRKNFDWDAEFKQAVAERDAKVKKLFDRLPDNEPANRFKTLFRWAFDCWGADEDHHFYIDAMIAAKSRYFLKNVGRTLVRNQVVANEEDIFYLYLEDVIDALHQPKPLHEAVEHSRKRHQENIGRQPMPFFGTPPSPTPDPVIERIFGWTHLAKDEPARLFKGNAASAGTYTGTVKIISGQEDFPKLTKGDILVCKTTMPLWTVLFPIAGALVTDAGGILSHASTVAREYKLPAVVGTKVATSLLRDGDRITVDGTNGIVYIG